MSNQFYNYISSVILEYFQGTGIKNGDRFYLQLDKQSDVSALIESLENKNARPFQYQHEYGDKYETFSIPFENIQLVVAYTSEKVKPDFLVTLRNQVGEQRNEWENTALLSLVSEQLDSIQGGSSDLQKEGMPLHPSSLFLKLKKQIEDSELNKIEKLILLDNLKNLLTEQTYQQLTIFEFEDIFSTLQRGNIADTDYYKFGIFRDPDLDTFKGKAQTERLIENRELFEFVRKVHEFGLGSDELEKRFTPEGAKELLDVEWKNISFPKVYKLNEEFIVTNKGKKIDIDSIKINGNLLFWERPQKNSAAGNRKRHIIVFNSNNEEEITIQVSFRITGSDKSLSQQYFTVPNQFKVNTTFEVKRTNVLVNVHTERNKVRFIRFSYKHEKKAQLGADFLVAILPVNPEYFNEYKSNYVIDPVEGSIGLHFEDEVLNFGHGLERKEVQIDSNQNQPIEITNDLQVKVRPLPEAFDDNDELLINLKFDQTLVPIKLKNELPESMPISGQRLWKTIRETGKDVRWVKGNNRLVHENREFYFHSEYKDFFNWENSWVENGIKAAEFSSDQLVVRELSLSEDLREAYSRLINYFKPRESIPSLSAVTEEYKQRALEYLKIYINEIKKFEDGAAAGRKGMDLFKLGTIQANETIYFTPFHPISVAFKLKMYEQLEQEEVDNSILNRLNPVSLVPFIYDDRDLYRPEHQQAAMEWIVYKPVNQVSVSDANQYLAKVVMDKISQFREHFSYLFMEKSEAPLQLNIINIANDIEIVRGIILWMIRKIERNGINNLGKIEVTIYTELVKESAFDLYARTESVQQIEDTFNLKIKSKEYEQDDLLRKIRENLSFYKKDPNSAYRYAHISFYKMNAQENFAVQPYKEMVSGFALEGLYASVPTMRDEETYKAGFGIKGYSIKEDNVLTTTALYVNELAANLRNSGNDSYRKGESIFSRTTSTDSENLERIFKASLWVTFVDPTIDLEYFNEQENLVVIHYSDQYSSSNRYDAITVTDKSHQYYAVIKEFLKQKDIEGNDENVLNTIKAFNTFNGEWLLRIIGSKGQYDREKLSIISAIKYAVSYFDHPNIIWIPISLEEILRVAGAVSLSRIDGVFTAKNLGVKGSHSDDLLLIGLEESEGEISLHFYPVEVKIGLNRGDVLDKAQKQVRQTKNLFRETLIGETGKSFTGKFYRNFFVQLLISSAQRLHKSGFWLDKNYNLSESVIEKLLKDQYEISNSLTHYVGEGAILSFQKDAFHRSAEMEAEVLLLTLTEKDGYEGLVKPISNLWQWIQKDESDFVKEDMLSYQYQVSSNTNDKNQLSNLASEKSPSIINKHQGEEYLTTTEIATTIENEVFDKEAKVEKKETDLDFTNKRLPLENARILIGKAANSNKDIYWEYGNSGLANRHLLISGKSGQGKTYFMQCLLLEKSKLGIPSIIIDYTEGFLPNQLEEEFVSALGDHLKQKIVYSEKLPLNPFEKNTRDIGGILLPESNTDIAERVKSVFSSVYKQLGIQQLNAIYEAILNGLQKFGDQMSLVKLRDLLEEDGSNYSKTALSQIRPLIDRDPFSINNTIKWSDIIESNGDVYVIQLTGFPRDVQLIITEFILWDLWNYSVKNGTKNKPMPVIMDEAQNLDHTEKSPSARILTEGRKFGWSAWYATQFLKSQLDADELARLQNSSQKIYFSPPEQEISHIASNLSKEPSERKLWEGKLSSLKKGQCIVHGPLLKENGELSNPTITVVDIIPLSERI
ncbi:DNA phosphorothioation-dependent restriction protein DptH [Metabacillus sp. RGM 3146]|uniref:DNA phosphorothioation-dependent restriction protein DptH n=1 Tax=Metabacillus sp. RGM 3146 TaxID=3401092 RepID=UPI003B9BEBEE